MVDMMHSLHEQGRGEPRPEPSTEQRLRPARQPGGDRAEVVAADDRNARQLLLQRGAQQRRTCAAAGQVDHLRRGLAAGQRGADLLWMRINGCEMASAS